MKKILVNSKGITIIALVLTVIVMLILASITIQYGKKEIDKVNIEDIKTTMLLIKGKVQIIADKEAFGEFYDNTGMIPYAEATEFTANIPNELTQQLVDTTNLYIWNQTAMDNNDINVEITNEDFFIIDYETLEIYYSLGYEMGDNTYYSLTELQGL